MKGRNLFLRYQDLKLKSPQGQVAALFIVLIAAVFIFMAIVINIGKIGTIKTALDNAVDGAALTAASILGSYTHTLNVYVRCEEIFDWWALIKWVLVVVTFVACFPLATLTLFEGVALVGALYSGIKAAIWGGTTTMKGMSFADQIIEGAMIYVFAQNVSDLNLTQDINDLDKDNDTNDEVSTFAEWWNRRLSQVKHNLLVSLNAWDFLMGYTDTNGNFIDGPVSIFEKKIDYGFVYPDQTTGTGTYQDDYAAYIKERLIPLLKDLMVRYYIGRGIDQGRFNFEEIRDNIHMNVELKIKDECVYSDYNYGCWKGDTYAYSGLFKEGNCDRGKFDPERYNSSGCDRIDEMLWSMNEFLVYVEGLRDTEEFFKLAPETVLSQFLDPLPFDKECKNMDRGNYAGRYCKTSSNYELLHWQEQIVVWRNNLIAVDNSLTANIQACIDNCANNTCVEIFSGSCPYEKSDACHVYTGMFSVASAIGANLEYDSVYRHLKLPVYCTDLCGGEDELDWGCYFDCYQDIYWEVNEYQENLAPYYGNCMNGCFASEWPSSLINCRNGCNTFCNTLYGMENATGPVLFHDRIQEVLLRLGDPNNSAGGGLYWDIETLRTAMTDAYNKLDPALARATRRATYAWKDSQGWHLVMSEVGGFAQPYLDQHSSSSWLGLKKKTCVELHMNGPSSIDVWAWRYDQSKDLTLAGQGNIPWWKFQYGRKQNVVEPAFMSNAAINNWKDLGLLNFDNALRDIECFICRNGLRSHARAGFGTSQADIKIIDSKWTSPHFCVDCGN